MIALVILWIVSVLANDAGHHALAQFGEIVAIIGTVFWTIGFLAMLASND